MTKAGQGRRPETVNHYVRAVRGFFRWMVKAKRVGSNALDSLTLLNSSVDVRHARRELTEGELRRLFAARSSVRSYRGLTGEDRFFLYLVAAAPASGRTPWRTSRRPTSTSTRTARR